MKRLETTNIRIKMPDSPLLDSYMLKFKEGFFGSLCYLFYAVNSEIFARFFFREISHMRSFVKIKSSGNGTITLSFTDEGKSCHSRDFLRRRYVF